MHSVTLNAVCMILALTQVGCRSVYRLECSSFPPVAGVLIGEQVMGETPCTIAIPRNSEMIRDHKVELTFCLPDGREKVHVVDLHGRKPSNPLAEIVAAPFVFTGLGLVLLFGGDDEDKDEDFPSFASHKKHDNHDHGVALLGWGVMGIGAGVYWLLGGDGASLSGHEVHVDFREPEATKNEEIVVQ